MSNVRLDPEVPAVVNMAVDLSNFSTPAPVAAMMMMNGVNPFSLNDPYKVEYSNPAEGRQIEGFMALAGGVAGLRSLALDGVAVITESTVFFGQRRVSERFSPIIDGKGPPDYLADRLISDVATDLRFGRLHPDQLPIQAFDYEGQLVSANTRSLSALSEAGLKPTNIKIIEPTDDLLLRLQETPLRSYAPLPGPKTFVTPTRNNLTIVRPITVPGY